MKLVHTIEKMRKGVNQVIEITANANSRERAADLGYNDFEANLFIDNKFIAEISNLLDKAGVWEKMIDDVNWEVMYCEMCDEACYTQDDRKDFAGIPDLNMSFFNFH